MPTQLDVYNAALDLLGEPALTTIDQVGPEVPLLDRQWDFALPELLRQFPWNWAKKRDDLESASPAPSYGWEARYPLPDDFVTLLAINEETRLTPGSDYEIEGVYLMTDSDAANIEYIAKPTDGSGSLIDEDWTTEAMLNRMDPLALNALVTLLAAKIATRISKDGLATSDALLNRYYNNDLVKARVRNQREAKKPYVWPSRTSNWLTARHTSTNG